MLDQSTGLCYIALNKVWNRWWFCEQGRT